MSLTLFVNVSPYRSFSISYFVFVSYIFMCVCVSE